MRGGKTKISPQESVFYHVHSFERITQKRQVLSLSIVGSIRHTFSTTIYCFTRYTRFRSFTLFSNKSNFDP